MKNPLILAAIFLFPLSSLCQKPQKIITDSDLSSGQNFWVSDTIYILDGLVYLEEGFLEIEKNTVIKARRTPSNGDETSALIITKNAQIFALGDYFEPIIFTSELDDTDDDDDLNKDQVGLWGGIVILGNAPIISESSNGMISNLEFLPSSDRSAYGGNDINDDRGRMNFVSIRFAGADIGNQAMPALTLAGLGQMYESFPGPFEFSLPIRDVYLDYLEVFGCRGTGVHILGGNVGVKHLSVSYTLGDSYSWDEGFVGKMQYLFSLQSENAFNKGIHGRGKFSNPEIYNATLIGAGTDGSSSNDAIFLESGTAATIGMSYIVDFAGAGIEIEDIGGSQDDSWNRLVTGDIKFLSNRWASIKGGNKFEVEPNGIIGVSNNADNPLAEELIDHLIQNDNEIEISLISNISRIRDGQLSPDIIGFENLPFPSFYPIDDFFAEVLGTNCEGRGAFVERGAWWLKYWTALDMDGYLRHPCFEDFLLSLELEGFLPDSIFLECGDDINNLSELEYFCNNSKCGLQTQTPAIAMRMRRRKRKNKEKSFNRDFCYIEEWVYEGLERTGSENPLSLPLFSILDTFEFVIETYVQDNEPPNIELSFCFPCPEDFIVSVTDCDSAWISSERHEDIGDAIIHEWIATDYCDNQSTLTYTEHYTTHECGTAPMIIPMDTCVTARYSNFNANSISVSPPSMCEIPVQNDMVEVWFKSSVPSSGSMTIDVLPVAQSALQSVYVQVYKGECGNLELYTCDQVSDENMLSRVTLMNATVGEPVLIRLISDGDIKSQGDFEICLVDGAVLSTAIEEIDALSGNMISISPNPFTHEVSIGLHEELIQDGFLLDIIDLKGHIVYSSRSSDIFNNRGDGFRLRMDHLAAGVYFIRVKSSEGFALQRIVKL